MIDLIENKDHSVTITTETNGEIRILESAFNTKSIKNTFHFAKEKRSWLACKLMAVHIAIMAINKNNA